MFDVILGLFSYPFSSGQVQVQQQMSPQEYAAMQERENAIAQLEVSEQQDLEMQQLSPADRELREAENRELAQLETDISTMAEVFTEVHKLVHEQGEQMGKESKIIFSSSTIIIIIVEHDSF